MGDGMEFRDGHRRVLQGIAAASTPAHELVNVYAIGQTLGLFTEDVDALLPLLRAEHLVRLSGSSGNVSLTPLGSYCLQVGWPTPGRPAL